VTTLPAGASLASRSNRDVIVFPAPVFERVRAHLLSATPLESAHFLFARPVKSPAGAWRLIVHDELELEDSQYTRRTEVGIELPPVVVAQVLKRAGQTGSCIIAAHSHPFHGFVRPSPTDLRGESDLLPAFQRRVPGVPHARLIVGMDGLHAGLMGHLQEGGATLRIQTMGSTLTTIGPSFETPHYAVQHDRQILAFGQDGQAQLRALRVAIVGLGGTGSIAAEQLAHLGVGSFLLIDMDSIDPTSLNRVVGTTPEDVGRPKIEIAQRMVQRINPAADVQILHADIRDAEILRHLLDVDFFLICTDSHGSRAVITQFAYQYLVPGIDMGVVIHANTEGVSHIAGRVQMLGPGLPCLLCGNVLDSEEVRRDLLTDAARAADPYIPGQGVAQPAVISINGATSSLAVTMLLSAVTGVPIATRNQRLRLESGIISRVETEAHSNCPVCSPSGALAKGDTWPMPGRSA
jgi:molybdopterin/thiamine biosynthesis adenylyltransferase